MWEKLFCSVKVQNENQRKVRHMYLNSTCFLHVPKELFCSCECTRSGPTESAAYVSEALICGKTVWHMYLKRSYVGSVNFEPFVRKK